MPRRHHFADLPVLKHRLERQLHPLLPTLPWLLRQGIKRRLDADGLGRDVAVLGTCLAPLAVFGIVCGKVWGYPNLMVGSSGYFVHIASLIAFAVLAVKCLHSAYSYFEGQAPASEVTLRALHGLVLKDVDAADYVHALFDGNESPRNIDLAVAATLARRNGQTVPAVFSGPVSVWNLWDWHHGVTPASWSEKHDN